TAPGSTAQNPITDLAELTTAKGLSKVIAAVASVVSKPGGYRVNGDVIAPTRADPSWHVVVKVIDAWSGDQLAVKTVAATDDIEACRAAGFWAAAYVLSRSTRIPSWGTWSPESAAALAASPNSGEATVEALENALASAPTSGLLLADLGYRYDLSGQTLD